MATPRSSEAWPTLAFDAWHETQATLHLWTQIVGKIRLAQSPWINHSWHVTLYLTSRGLTTGPVPHGNRTFQIDFDFIGHELTIRSTDGGNGRIPLRPQSVATFYASLMAEMKALDLPVEICRKPNEIPDAIPFDQDTVHDAYDPDYANRFWRVLVQVDRIFKAFRASFTGKCSPVHFFWGAADLAVTRFSGRPAPEHPGGIPNIPDWITREAYSQEVSSCGFWPGAPAFPQAAFYSYAYPEPPGFATAAVQPDGASYSQDLHEFILPYDVVRESASPDEALLRFLQTSYAAAADSGRWDWRSLERGGDPRDAI